MVRGILSQEGGEGCGEGKAVESGDDGGVGGKHGVKVADGLAREHGSGRVDRR